MNKLEMKLSEDRKTAHISFSPAEADVTAEELTQLIQGMLQIRAKMSPDVPGDPNLTDPVQISERDPRFWVFHDPMQGGAVLGIRHQGLGWIWTHHPEQSAQKMAQLLMESGTSTQSPSKLN